MKTMLVFMLLEDDTFNESVNEYVGNKCTVGVMQCSVYADSYIWPNSKLLCPSEEKQIFLQHCYSFIGSRKGCLCPALDKEFVL